MTRCCKDPDLIWDLNDMKYTCLSCGREQKLARRLPPRPLSSTQDHPQPSKNHAHTEAHQDRAWVIA